MLSIQLPNDRKLAKADAGIFLKAFNRGIDDGARRVAAYVVRNIQRSLLGTRSGIKYAHLPHRSSAEGEAPRSQTGRLSRGIKGKVIGRRSINITSTAPYSADLEYDMNRPFFYSTLLDREDNVKRILEQRVRVWLRQRV